MITEYFNTIDIIQIGCGGTGGWLAPLVAKLVRNIVNRNANCTFSYALIDNDIVEERNILRQNFLERDIGKPKVLALANRYILELEKNLDFFNEKITGVKKLNMIIKPQAFTDSRRLIILLGCVDNNSTRRLLYKYMNNLPSHISCIYIDSGNDLNKGQIITTWFNLPEFIDNQNQTQIKFLKLFAIKKETQTEQSCAFFGDQTQGLNNFAASIIFLNLQSILITNKLPINYIEFYSNGYSSIKI